jgi:hypothetical protein
VPITSRPVDSEQVPIATTVGGPEQVLVAATPPKSVAAPQHLEQDDIAMKGGQNPPPSNEQPAASSHEKRAARSQGTASTRNQENTKASARKRPPDAPAYAQQHDVRQPSQLMRTRHDRDSGREFIDADGFRHIILPRRRSEPNEDIPAVKQVEGDTFHASEATDLMSQDDMRFACRRHCHPSPADPNRTSRHKSSSCSPGYNATT